MEAHGCIDCTKYGSAPRDNSAETQASYAKVLAKAIGDVEKLGVDKFCGVNGKDRSEG